MSHKLDRLQLIRERHRKIILEPRKKVELDVWEDWSDDFDFVDEAVLSRHLRDRTDED
jgi:hypothetical protein